jgi:GntR family transcriptional regulator / MocR family aminotransferase
VDAAAGVVGSSCSAAGGQQFYVTAIDQLTMADFIENGQYDKHIRRMRLSYRRRRHALAPITR